MPPPGSLSKNVRQPSGVGRYFQLWLSFGKWGPQRAPEEQQSHKERNKNRMDEQQVKAIYAEMVKADHEMMSMEADESYSRTLFAAAYIVAAILNGKGEA